MRSGWQRPRNWLSQDAGYTLIEVLVSVGILTSVTVAVTLATFSILSTQQKWRDEVLSTQQLRTSGASFGTDAMVAFTTTLPDKTTSTGLTLWWTDVLGQTTTATFVVTGTSTPYTLVRQLTEETSGGNNNSEKELSTRVVTSTFYRSGKTITFDLKVQGYRSDVKTTTAQGWLRNAD